MIDKKINVLYVCSSPTYYGDNIALMNIIPHLEEYGVNPFFLIQKEGDFADILKQRGYRFAVCKFAYNNLYNLRNPVLSYIKRAIKGMIHDMALKKYIQIACTILGDFKPDIIHSNNTANRFGLLLSKKLNVPHVWHIREYMDKDHNMGFFPSKHVFESMLNSSNNSCISITQDVASHFSTTSENRVIYDGVVPYTDKQLALGAKEDIILFVGRLLETKGVFDIIDAFICIAKRHPTYELWFVGEGDDNVKARLFDLIRKHGFEGRVKLMGYKTNVFDYMRKAKAIVVSSRFEAFGFITAEAMYNGCLVIGRNTAGTKMQFDNGVKFVNDEIGLRYNTTEELTRAMEKVMSLTKDEVFVKLNNAYKTVQHFYTTKNSAIKVFDYYIDILNISNGN